MKWLSNMKITTWKDVEQESGGVCRKQFIFFFFYNMSRTRSVHKMMRFSECQLVRNLDEHLNPLIKYVNPSFKLCSSGLHTISQEVMKQSQ